MQLLEGLENLWIDEHTRIVDVYRDPAALVIRVTARNYATDKQATFAIAEIDLLHYNSEIKTMIVDKFRRSDLCMPVTHYNTVVLDNASKTSSINEVSNTDWLHERVKEICNDWR